MNNDAWPNLIKGLVRQAGGEIVLDGIHLMTAMDDTLLVINDASGYITLKLKPCKQRVKVTRSKPKSNRLRKKNV